MLQVILAPNPSPLTGPGTNSFLIGRKQVAVIDPGPDIASHRQAIIDAAEGRISHIFVTHAHLDHSEGAAALSRTTGAPILAFGDCDAGRSPMMQQLGDETGGKEGRDTEFAPDQTLPDGAQIITPEWTLTALHTPGHMGNHMSFLWGDQLFCGDLILGWSSTLISPPDGDLIDYFRSLSRVEACAPARLLPAHGAPVGTPAARIAELRAHRQDRTAQILHALRDGPESAENLSKRLYNIPPELLPAATRNVLAHLLALTEIGALTAPETLSPTTPFAVR